MIKQLQSRWFLIALAMVLVLGYTQASLLSPLRDAAWLRQAIVACVMFLMALLLGARAMVAALKNPLPPLLGVAMNALAVPLAAWACYVGLRLMPEGDDMANGMLVAGATPCTLASAAVWTRRAGGNDAVALLVTIITNLFCFLITPFWLVTTTGNAIQSGDLSFGSMALKLSAVVVAPMALAQLLRLHPRVAQWANRHKTPIGATAQMGILMMVLLGAVAAGAAMNSDVSQLLGPAIAVMVVAVMAVHLGVLFSGMFLAKALKQRREDQIAVGIAGSQKTLMIGLHMAITYFPDSLAMLPMIVYHAGQLLTDTLIADRLRKSARELCGDRDR